MTTLHDGFRARVAALVERGRAVTDAGNLCDAVARDADAVAMACAEEATAAVDVVVPPDLRPAVLARLVERIDLVPWARSASDVWALAWSIDLMRGAVEDHDSHNDGATPEQAAWAQAVMLSEPLFLHRVWARHHDQNATTHALFGAAIDAITPPKRRQEVDAIAARDSAKTKERDPLTVRLVSWLFLDEMAPERLAVTAARATLGSVGDDLAKHPTALRELSRRVEDALVKAPLASDDVEVIDGIQPLDEALAALVEQCGPAGRKLAAEIRASTKTPEERAARWRPMADPLRVPRILARTLWSDVVRPQLQRLDSTHAALARVVHVDVVGLLRPGLSIRDDYVVDADGRQRMMFTQSQALDVPTVEMGAIPRLLRRGLELFGSIQTHRMLRHVVVEGHRQAITGEADPRVLRYLGGWSALAAQANVTEADDARAIVVALAHAAHELTDGTHGNLLSYSARRGAPGRPGLVSLVLGDMLLPHFVHSLDPSKARTPTENRRLVPIVDFAGFVGRNNDHAAQATLQMMFMARLRDAAPELAEAGAVRITDAEFAALAHEAGLTPALLPKVIDRWTRDGGDAPAFMVKTGDRYTLAPHFAPALAFLEAAGHMSLERSKAGKLSAARKGKPRRKKPAAP
jgi:hypothetical protein